MSLPLALDHIVVLVADLDAAVAAYRGRGFTVVAGGRHAAATHNALIGFDDGAYVELIAFYETAPDHRWWPRLATGGGIIAVCLHTPNLHAAVDAVRGHGIPMTDVAAQSRTRPDGVRLEWRLSFYDVGRDLLPFLIEDTTPRRDRVPPGVPHPNGCRTVGTVTFAINDLSEAQRWIAAIGCDAKPISAPNRDVLGLSCNVGAHEFVFLTPQGSGDAKATWLHDRGPGPYACTLKDTEGRILATL